ncbi:hypothetical protein A3D14_00680 [Candidatus Saccharibacteria bacterium RIFCSPHIGHO2_02_FULL_47_12]|nr:MAG: hypothetical protein A3D14_00680 [Candidatus Saccharibacteria bacterium RIFCSPHIGHO2_02_FULL_47_12]
MFNNILLKTIYSKRWGTITWSLGLALLVVFTMIFYPTISESFSQALTDVPDSLKTFIGDSSAYKTIAGYTDVQIISQYAFMTLIFGIILFSGLLAGEEGDGTLQALLVQPVKRTKVYLEKFVSASLLLAAASISISAGVYIGVLIIGEQIDIGRLAEATLALWLITLVFSALAYMLGAMTGRRGLAGGLAGALAFVSLLVTSLASSVKVLEIADKLSPFHYFNNPGILRFGPRWGDLAILALVTLLMLWLGAWFFKRRDIYQR